MSDFKEYDDCHHLFTIIAIAMDYPFTGNISIPPDVFTNMLSSLMN